MRTREGDGRRFFVMEPDARRRIQIGVVIVVVCWGCSAAQAPPSPPSTFAVVQAPEAEVVGADSPRVVDTADESVPGELVDDEGGEPFVVRFIRAMRRNPILMPPLAAGLGG